MSRSSSHRRGFTLIEVAIALAILGLSVGALMDGTIGSITTSGEVRRLTQATLVARAVMAEIEQKLNKDGFGTFDKTESCDFDIEALKGFGCEYAVKKIDLPVGDLLSRLFTGGGSGGGSGDLAAAARQLAGQTPGGGSTGSSAPGASPAAMAALAAGAGGPAGGLAANALKLAQTQIETIFEEALREVRLTLTWKVGRKASDSMTVVTHLVQIGRAGVTGADQLAGQVARQGGLQVPLPGQQQPGTTPGQPYIPPPPTVTPYVPRR